MIAFTGMTTEPNSRNRIRPLANSVSPTAHGARSDCEARKSEPAAVVPPTEVVMPSPASTARIVGMRSVAVGCDGEIGLIASRRTVPSRMYSWRSASRPGGCWSAGRAYSAATCSGVSSLPVCGSRIENGPSTRSMPSSATSSSL